MKISVKIHWAQLFDLNDPGTLRAFGRALPAASLVAGVTFWQASGWGLIAGVLAAVVMFVVAEVLVSTLVMGMVEGGARAMMSVVAPTGSSTPSVDDYSFEKSLIARGRIAEALTELEVRLANHPDDPALCLFAADVHAREARDSTSAERLYLHARAIPTATTAQDYAATNRLIDLYLGPLDNTARAMEELERTCTRHPGTSAARGAEQALMRLKDSHAATPDPYVSERACDGD